MKCFGNWPDIINTGLQTGAYEVWSSNSRFNGLSKQRSRSKPLKRLKRARQAMTTGLKTGVNKNQHSVKPVRQISRTLQIPLQLGRSYLENGYARIFGELPLEFSNDAPALI